MAVKALFFTLALLALIGAAVTAGAAPVPDARQIHARGCVQAAVESRCLVLKDVETGKLYSLVIKGAGPDIGTGIDFTGIPFNGATTCMQGAPVQVTSWSRKDYLKCSRGRTSSVQ
jgi:hypothetical protein